MSTRIPLTNQQLNEIREKAQAPRKLVVLAEDPQSRAAHSWVNFTAAPALTNDQLALLRTEASRLGRPLTDAETKIVLGEIAGSTATLVTCGPDDNGVIVGT
jgi:hypothetical protein